MAFILGSNVIPVLLTVAVEPFCKSKDSYIPAVDPNNPLFILTLFNIIGVVNIRLSLGIVACIEVKDTAPSAVFVIDLKSCFLRERSSCAE